jgi:hypothetical protein
MSSTIGSNPKQCSIRLINPECGKDFFLFLGVSSSMPSLELDFSQQDGYTSSTACSLTWEIMKFTNKKKHPSLKDKSLRTFQTRIRDLKQLQPWVISFSTQ